jgi:hypothetical protein
VLAGGRQALMELADLIFELGDAGSGTGSAASSVTIRASIPDGAS